MSGFFVAIQRLVRRFTIRKPCWVCNRCGWRERREAETRCWKCRDGEMIFRRPAMRFGKDKRGQWFGQWFRSDGSLRFASHGKSLAKVVKRIWEER